MKQWMMMMGALAALACGGEQTTAEPAQRIEIAVGAHGYEPASVNVQSGREIVLAFTRTTDEGCGQVLVVPSHDIRRDLPLNETVEISLPPQAAASNIRFTCGMNMLEGAVVIQ